MTYTEDTFKGSTWTVFHQMAPRREMKLVYDFVAVQAPRGVAEDLMRKAFEVDVSARSIYEEVGDLWGIHEDCKDIQWVLALHFVSVKVIAHDYVPYLISGVFKPKAYEML